MNLAVAGLKRCDSCGGIYTQNAFYFPGDGHQCVSCAPEKPLDPYCYNKCHFDRPVKGDFVCRACFTSKNKNKKVGRKKGEKTNHEVL